MHHDIINTIHYNWQWLHRDWDCRVLLWAEKLGPGAGLWAGLLSCYCQLELEVTITDVVNLWQSPSVSNCTAWKFENVLTLALLKSLRLVHFFRGPLKELANAISVSPHWQATASR